MSDIRILTLDPAFRNTGWAVINLHPASEEILAAGVITTKKIDKKLKSFAGSDNHRCAQIIAAGILKLLEEWKVEIICAEAQAGSKNSRAAMLMGMGWGIISAISHLQNLPVLQVRPQEVKEVNVGSKRASKEEIKEAVCARYPEAEKAIEHIKPPSLREHAYDAVAVAVACFDSTEIATLRRLSAI